MSERDDVEALLDAHDEEPPKFITPWRAWVEARLQSDEAVRAANLRTFEERQKREHLKTRAWVLLVTAPAWGNFASQMFGGLSTVEGTLGGAAAVIAASGLYLIRGLIRGGVN